MTPAFGGIGLDSPPFSQPLLFAVSADQTVTSISIGYKYAGCSGTKTLSGLSIPIGVSIFKPELPGWTYESAPPGDPNRAQFWVAFRSDQQAYLEETILVPGCGYANADGFLTKQQ